MRVSDGPWGQEWHDGGAGSWLCTFLRAPTTLPSRVDWVMCARRTQLGRKFPVKPAFAGAL